MGEKNECNLHRAYVSLKLKCSIPSAFAYITNPDSERPSFGLSVYSHPVPPGSDLDLDLDLMLAVGGRCVCVVDDLGFQPYQLTSADVYIGNFK